jgi:NADH-quinone oxidoreductase subunit M
MILVWSIAFITLGGLIAWIAGRYRPLVARWIALVVLTVNFAGFLWLWIRVLGANFQVQLSPLTHHPWLVEVDQPWIPQLGIHFHLALDGLSLILILLASFLGIVAVAASWREIQDRVGFFHFSLLWIVAALIGVFVAVDLFLFYFFWELMLVPLYFLIGIWGHENREAATLKFFIYTQFSGLFMLLAILGLYFVHGQATGIYTFDYEQLLGTVMQPTTALLLSLGFFLAFAVKLPAFPFHTWLPLAHTEAPTAGSVVLAGLVLKAGAYGFLRFMIPLFPAASFRIDYLVMALAVIGILYGALLAFAQTDLKRMVAYTSVSHMGFVLLGIFAWNNLALQGAVIVIVAHGISTGGLFVLVGQLYERTGTRDLSRMGGLWEVVPRMGRVGLVLALAALGLPGLANFVGEFLVLLGVYDVSPRIAVLAALGFILAAVYALWMLQRIFAGPEKEARRFEDIHGRELAIMTVLMAIVFWLGLYPQPVLDTSEPSVRSLQAIVDLQLGEEEASTGLPCTNLVTEAECELLPVQYDPPPSAMPHSPEVAP